MSTSVVQTKLEIKRKVAAILYADVAGYSRLVDDDEDGSFIALKVGLREIRIAVGLKGGHVCHVAGDAILAEFNSVTAALECALGLQRSLVDLEGIVTENRQLQFRMGINVGEVIVDDQEIYGHAVNVAARLEAFAEPGGICISASVLEQVECGYHVECRDLGLQCFKNIKRPVHVFGLNVNSRSCEFDHECGSNDGGGTSEWRALAF